MRDRRNCLDFAGGFVYYEAVASANTNARFHQFQGGVHVIKATQEQLQEKIKTLKQKAAEKVKKAAGKKSDPDARTARKKVKRVQRKLRAVKTYKAVSKKAQAANAAETKAPA
jgi:metal-dependent hydrolase (beta-lactamase superfamily II)